MSNLTNAPSIGESVLSPSAKFACTTGEDRYDQLLADGSSFAEVDHPILYGIFSGTLPSMTSPDAACPYRIIADLTGA